LDGIDRRQPAIRRIPNDDDTRADLLLDSAEFGARLRKIDHDFKDCFAEIAESLRDYIQQHFELFRKELEDEDNRVL
jgi:hypothetical protein